jgi:hypothetical protein
MNFVILVPIAWLPLLFVVWLLQDYLLTMAAWFLLGLIADVSLFILLTPVPQADALGFAICLLLIPLVAPFVGIYARDKREQREQQEADLKRAERKRQDYLNYLQQQEELEREGQGRRFFSAAEGMAKQKSREQYLLYALEYELREFTEAETFRSAKAPPE